MEKQVKPKAKSRSLLNSLRLFVVFGLSGVIAAVVLTQILAHLENFSSVAERLRMMHMEQQKAVIQREVERVVQHVRHVKDSLHDTAALAAKGRIDMAHRIIDNLLLQNDATPAQPIEGIILDTLRAIRFDGGTGYYFAISPQGTVLMHAALPATVGDNLWEMVDSKGNYFFRELLDMALQKGEGSREYHFSKPGEDSANESFTKVSYVRYLKNVDWVVGTGVYIDDLEATQKTDLLTEIQQIRYGDNGYIFVDDWEGVVLAHGAQPELIGKNIWDHTDANGVKVVQKLIAAARTEQGDFVHYSWKKPNNGKERAKISFAMGIEGWRWMVGAGVYLDDIDQAIGIVQQAQLISLAFSLAVTLVSGVVVGLLSFLWLKRLYNQIVADHHQFQGFFASIPEAKEVLTLEPLHFDEHLTLAEQMNRMLAEKLVAESHLRSHQLHLEDLIEQRTRSLEEKSHELERLATTDSLTGLHNRRGFTRLFEHHLRELVRYDVASCLVIVDIDFFKRINDQYGHKAGDMVLAELTALIGKQLRASDVFGRWGGEEFSMLLSHTPQDHAMEMCQRLRASLAQANFEGVGQVTASFGLTRIHKDDSLDSALIRADQALYKAKQNGRNRVEIEA